MTEDESQPSSSLRPANRILTASRAAHLMLGKTRGRSLRRSPRPVTLDSRPAEARSSMAEYEAEILS